MIEIGTGPVRLRTLRIEDLDALVEGTGDGNVGPRPDRAELTRRLREMIEKSPTLTEDGVLNLGITDHGVLVGDIQARAPKHAWPPGDCEIGITVFGEQRGRAIGRTAVQLLVDDLFAQGWQRIQAGTAVDNRPMRRVLEVVGFTQEGVLRGFAPGEGGRQDYVLYAILATDPRPS